MTEQVRRVSCIVCPISCQGEVVFENGQIKEVRGFNCPRGKAYAQTEVTAPKRMLTSTVKVKNGTIPLLPVVSKQPLPKGKIMDCAKALREVCITAPVKEGDIVCPNILGLGVDIIASRDLAAAN